MSIAERMSEKTGTAVTSEAAAKYSSAAVVDNGTLVLRFIKVDAELGQELKNIFESLEKCISLREQYLSDSLQCLGDNPKDLDEWEIYRNFALTDE